jgi:DNA polymerase-3 subunit delta'
MWQVKGQDNIVRLLERAVSTNSLAHAYVVVGPRHVGKRTLALNFAQALNCPNPDPPCGRCSSCRRIWAGKHPDVTLVALDYGTEISIEEVRELQRLASLPPYEGNYKVFIIDDADYLSSEAANSLLKILEEPPSKIIWLLLAVEEGRLLATITSRCQRLELKPLPLDQVEQVLVRNYAVEHTKAPLLARLSHGCLGWALSALQEDDILQQRHERITRFSSLLTASLEQRLAYAADLAGQFSQDRKSAIETLGLWLEWWRDLLLIKAGCTAHITNIDYEKALEKQAKMLDLAEIKEFLSRLRLATQQLSQNINPRLACESLLLNLPRKTEL